MDRKEHRMDYSVVGQVGVISRVVNVNVIEFIMAAGCCTLK